MLHVKNLRRCLSNTNRRDVALCIGLYDAPGFARFHKSSWSSVIQADNWLSVTGCDIKEVADHHLMTSLLTCSPVAGGISLCSWPVASQFQQLGALETRHKKYGFRLHGVVVTMQIVNWANKHFYVHENISERKDEQAEGGRKTGIGRMGETSWEIREKQDSKTSLAATMPVP